MQWQTDREVHPEVPRRPIAARKEVRLGRDQYHALGVELLSDTAKAGHPAWSIVPVKAPPRSSSLVVMPVVNDPIGRLDDLDLRGGEDGNACLMRLSEIWPAAPVLRGIFADGRVRGIVTSLLGRDPLYDHHFPPVTEPGHRHGDNLHQDAIFNPRPFAFDVRISIFPQETTRAMGGTLFVPGSHFRRVNEGDIHRYQHLRGQEQITCPAGTFVIWHNNLWHSGRTNRSTERRMMFKLRLQPRERQYRTWDLTDLGDPEVDWILDTPEPWHGGDARIEIMQRRALFRYLSDELPRAGAAHFAHYWDRAAEPLER